MENIIYACLCINPNFHYINLTLLINFLKTIHEYSSLKIPICRSPYAIVSACKKALCGKVCAYTSPANFMPQLMRVSYIRRVRARLSCGV